MLHGTGLLFVVYIVYDSTYCVVLLTLILLLMPIRLVCVGLLEIFRQIFILDHLYCYICR